LGKGPSAPSGTLPEFGQLAKGFGGASNAWLGLGSDNLKSAGDFYQALLSGGKAAQGVVAPSAMNISRVYGGNANTIKNFMPAGGERNLALAQNQNQRAQSIADLYTNVQPAAAQGLAGLGQVRAGVGGNLGQLASGGYGDLTAYQGQRNAAKGATLGGIGQGLGTIAGAGIMHCWVAEVLYGTLDERTFAIRHWLMRGDLPWNWKLFGRAYGAIGQRLAQVLLRHSGLQRFVRPLFDRAVTRATKGRL